MNSERMELIREFRKAEVVPPVEYTLNNDDIDLILRQVYTDREEAKKLLIRFNGDCVKVIIHILENN